MTHLSVNLNKVALLRNARPLDIPSVTRMAQVCIEAGAHGITVHPRPDERHIRRADVYALAELLTDFHAIEFNIEGNPLESPWMDIVRQVKPAQATLVPDAPGQSTSDHGWNIRQDGERLKPIIQELQALGCRVSLFMDPDPAQIARLKDLGCMGATAPMETRIELYTEPYATAYRQGKAAASLERYAAAAKMAQSIGLGVNGGHDLNLENLPQFCTIPHILEVSIGHALTADALEMGMAKAVQAYLAVLHTQITQSPS
ncbi:pyridoxine 5'-phosphate synthase [Romeria aff. gracilis LEGE 07310]|uniref:Pyridoxine 5'-phosphate synthase n=1 Tax=Vasconcelosia minhoensis LEGE 07310 TaxID=915328 RepID=A0A8J7AT32_9CYAN|nr:pyridoxine 5'-phosphate synthase [Romeria gracilis]MBE9075903.1 pyridoxine 5'-phosphate synthase [Romeria aff. gracilis LEGE 07310]